MSAHHSDGTEEKHMTEPEIQAKLDELKKANLEGPWKLFTLNKSFNMYCSSTLEALWEIFESAYTLQNDKEEGWLSMGIVQQVAQGTKVWCSYRRIGNRCLEEGMNSTRETAAVMKAEYARLAKPEPPEIEKIEWF